MRDNNLIITEIDNEITKRLSSITSLTDINKFEVLELFCIELMQTNLDKKTAQRLLKKINSSLDCI